MNNNLGYSHFERYQVQSQGFDLKHKGSEACDKISCYPLHNQPRCEKTGFRAF